MALICLGQHMLLFLAAPEGRVGAVVHLVEPVGRVGEFALQQ